ncbi:MAG TPA: DNA cytosine methyltransferase [Gemmatimonadales bacterium]|nr:DNA cytosine methyltransferase [Gemmatimonadales bacterium]
MSQLRKSAPVAIDLFCGCGGLTLGLKQAGFRVIWAVDESSLAVETYRVNHPEVLARETDIQRIDADALRKELGLAIGELGLLAGCPPCEGFSTLRTLNGSKGVKEAKNDLVLQFIPFARAFKPQAIMLENVPALADDPRFAEVLTVFAELGYRTEHKILNAADFGVPQRRRRLILLATKRGAVSFAVPGTNRRTVRDAIGKMPGVGRSKDKLHDLKSRRRKARIRRLIRAIPHNGGSRRSLGKRRQLTCHTDFDGFKDVYGRMAWDAVSPTITSGCVNPSKGRFLHPVRDRAISLREAALLQTFPRRYFFSLRFGKYAAADLIGNALPPEFVRRHAVQLAAHVRS